MLRLANLHSMKINDSRIYATLNFDTEMGHLDHFEGVMLKNRRAFLGAKQKMFTLTQNYPIDERAVENSLEEFR